MNLRFLKKSDKSFFGLIFSFHTLFNEKLKIIYSILSAFLVCLFPFSLKASSQFLSGVDLSLKEIVLISLSFIISFLVIKKTVFLQVIYILFHEISHTIAAILSKGKIHKIKVTRDLGYVKSDKSNLVIRLAPYLFPLLPMIMVILMGFIKLIVGIYYPLFNQSFLNDFFLVVIFVFLFSTTYYNFYLIKSETTDIDQKQVLFSILLIANTYTITTSLVIAYCFSINELTTTLLKHFSH